MTKDALHSLEELISLGVDRVLTSGQESSCLEGLDLLHSLIDAAQDRIIIVPGGGITERNIQKIIKGSNAKEFHVSGRTSRDGPMIFRNSKCPMGGALRPPEFTVSIVDSSKISSFIKNASN